MSEAQSDWLHRVLGVPVLDPAAQQAATSPPSETISPLQLWLDAKEAAGSQVAALQDAMRAVGRPVFDRLADQGLHGVTGRLQVGLQVALTEAERTSGEAQAAARQKARAAVEDFRGFLASDPTVKLLEANPFRVNVSLRAGLGRALDAIDRSLGA